MHVKEYIRFYEIKIERFRALYKPHTLLQKNIPYRAYPKQQCLRGHGYNINANIHNTSTSISALFRTGNNLILENILFLSNV